MTTTPYTTPCNPGDVILVPFKFTDSDAVKPRPAIIVSVSDYQTSRADAVMLAVTGRAGRAYFGDCQIVDWKQAGLVKPSTAKGVFRTIDQRLVHQHLGTLTAADYSRVQDSVKSIFGVS